MQKITTDSSSCSIPDDAMTPGAFDALPFDIIRRIGQFCSPSDQAALTLTSRNTSRYFTEHYAAILRIFNVNVSSSHANEDPENDLEDSFSLLYVENILAREKQLVSEINSDLVRQIRLMDGGQAFLEELKRRRTPFIAALSEMDSWLKNSNLLIFASGISTMRPFTRNLNSSFSLSQKAAAVRDWMKTNQEILNSVTDLHLGSKGLTALPPEVGRLSNLQWLYIHSNNLTALPPEIGRLSALQELNVSDNHLTTLPPEISRLSALDWLIVSKNNFLPPSLLSEMQERGVIIRK